MEGKLTFSLSVSLLPFLDWPHRWGGESKSVGQSVPPSGWLLNRIVLSHSSRGKKCEIKVLAGLCSCLTFISVFI